MKRTALAAFLLVLVSRADPWAAEESVGDLPAPIAAAQRVLFLGDSITYAGTYVDYAEAAVRLRDPGWRGEILDLGLPSETVSGLSEPGHADGRFPRPDLHERLARVLDQAKPDVVVACYGMNDGIYHPFAEERFARYRDGIVRLRAQAARVRAAVVHLTPPVFDPQPIRDRVLPAGSDAYPRPYAGYDDVLARYSAWLLEQRGAGWNVIDVHGPMRSALAARRAVDSAFGFTADGVHPDRLGHAVMARAVLLAWGFPAADAEQPLRWAAEPETELLRLIGTRRRLLSAAWLTATRHQRPGLPVGLPLPEATARAAEIDARLRTLIARPPADGRPASP